MRARVQVSGGAVRIARRPELEPQPAGDLLQAGPTGVLRNRPRADHGVDLPLGRPIVTALVFER